jgi:hypothetical protein
MSFEGSISVTQKTPARRRRTVNPANPNNHGIRKTATLALARTPTAATAPVSNRARTVA